jgi:uncharacterized membrane protein YdbT with pleckstrin-like domain
MGRRDLLREGEVRVISVTPVSRGVVRPLLVTLTTLALIVEGASRYALVHRFEDWLVLVLIGPLGLVTLTRIWRWRSHKVHVTNDRVIVEGGVLRHQRTSIEMRDVIATRVDQRMSERLTRRGYVFLETSGGPLAVGLVRHPAALCRLIDAERRERENVDVPFDTIYTFEDPDPYKFEVHPDQWQRRQYE